MQVRVADSTNQIRLGEAWNGIHADQQLVDGQFEKFFHLSAGAASGGGSISETAAIPLGGRLEYEVCGIVGYSQSVSNTVTVSVPSNTLDPNNSNDSDTVIMQDPRLFADGFENISLPPWCPDS